MSIMPEILDALGNQRVLPRVLHFRTRIPQQWSNYKKNNAHKSLQRSAITLHVAASKGLANKSLTATASAAASTGSSRSGTGLMTAGWHLARARAKLFVYVLVPSSQGCKTLENHGMLTAMQIKKSKQRAIRSRLQAKKYRTECFSGTWCHGIFSGHSCRCSGVLPP